MVLLIKNFVLKFLMTHSYSNKFLRISLNYGCLLDTNIVQTFSPLIFSADWSFKGVNQKLLWLIRIDWNVTYIAIHTNYPIWKKQRKVPPKYWCHTIKWPMRGQNKFYHWSITMYIVYWPMMHFLAVLYAVSIWILLTWILSIF